MIAVLDEQCSVASGSDAAFLAHLDAKYEFHQRFTSHKKDPANSGCQREKEFKICHFAGDVVYNSVGFVEKNNDTLFHDLKRMLYECG
jgi:myosin-1